MRHKTFPSWIVMGFFILGLISATAFRVIIIADRFDPALSRLIWYIGVIGYIFFFGYRYYVAYKRRVVIEENNLIEKMRENKLSPQNKEQVEYILKSIMKSKEMFNYIYIFLLSGLAIIADLVLNAMNY